MLGFRGNIAGAWRAFDEDLSGYISLKELDEEASKVLLGFRRWAIQEPLGGDSLEVYGIESLERPVFPLFRRFPRKGNDMSKKETKDSQAKS